MAALIAAVAVQVAVNYANDYFDAVKGVDSGERIGPRRVTAAGLVSPTKMRLAVGVALGVASIPGLALAVAIGPQVIIVGLCSFAAALGYSGGPKPFASLGLGEAFVFVFFGLVGTIGSAYVQTHRLLGLAAGAAVPVGFMAAALLLVNNIRDIASDAAAGKRTLAVRIGAPAARGLYLGTVAGAFVITIALAAGYRDWWALIALAAAPLALKPITLVLTRTDGPNLIRALVGTARVQLLYGTLLAIGFWLAW